MMNDETSEYLEDLNPEDLKLSINGLSLLAGAILTSYRYDSTRKELYLGFDNGRRLFVDNVSDPYDISIT
tara:strand:+ start:141 stop:350 length:210 start_codon:yes stop_codon:yes gene_type:complete